MTSYVLRGGKLVAVDEVCNAWTSGDLDRMIRASTLETNPIDRHSLLIGIVDLTHRGRKEARVRDLCLAFAERHIQEFPQLAAPLQREMNGCLPRVPTFQHNATVLSEEGEFAKAVAICELAISYDPGDGTASGFEGRIERIQKQRGRTVRDGHS